MNDNKHSLVCKFIDQDEPFTLGFECGIIWNRLETETTEFEMMVHTLNWDQIVLMTDSVNWSVEFQDTEIPEWIVLRFLKNDPDTKLLENNKSKLFVVKSMKNK